MATFKPVVRTPRKDGFYKVYIRVVHKIKPGYIGTDKLVTKKFIDKDGNITDPFVNEYCARRICGLPNCLTAWTTQSGT